MSACRSWAKQSFLRASIHSHQVLRLLSGTPVHCSSREWRISRGLPGNKTRYGPLTDLPDYTFLDGRPTPLNQGQKRRRQEQIEMSKRVVQLVGELKFAKDNHQKRLEAEKMARQRILDNKLHPKPMK